MSPLNKSVIFRLMGIIEIKSIQFMPKLNYLLKNKYY